ncbi:MAG TPA: pseudouridine synthase [Amoebophilaceae bacterium]|nr:pseudouridine synthase [Amoebophilaceae bacterium]
MSSSQHKLTHTPASSSYIRLNKFISNSGICARRAADQLIASGSIAVNGTIVRTLGIKIPPDAQVTYKGLPLQAEKLRYLLLNKPKGCVTSAKDPEGRKTVLDLISRKCCPEKVYPVGRLDYDTTGLLLLTNDGDLAQKLAHPSNAVSKLYHVVLDKAIAMEHFTKIKQGVLLEDGLAQIDCLSMVDQDPFQLGVRIHMGKNRIIRRIFEHFGYVVQQLDRVGYAHLTKKGIPRGKWIFLDHQTVGMLRKLV